MKLKLGSCSISLPGYSNVACAPADGGPLPDVICDIRTLPGFENNFVEELLSVHVVELFRRGEIVDILREWVRVLKPGGRLTLETLNLISTCQNVLQSAAGTSSSDVEKVISCLYGDPSQMDPQHRPSWLYTPHSLGMILHEVGLTDLKQETLESVLCRSHDMRITGIKPFPRVLVDPASPVKKRVLIVCSHFWPSVGGLESRMGQMATELAKAGYNVNVMTQPHPDRHTDRFNGVKITGIDYADLPSAARQTVASGELGTCILVQYPLGSIIWGMERLRHPPQTRLLLQPIINEQGYSRWKDNAQFSARLASIMQSATVPLVMTRSGPDTRFMQSAGIDAVYLPNATVQVPAAGDFRKRFRIADDRFLILHVANLWSIKNHIGLIQSLPRLPETWQFVMIGHEADESGYREKVMAELAKRPEILFIPGLPREWASAAMQASDVIVLASLGEGSPLTILEAMSHQKPWLATPQCGGANDHVGGIICPLIEFEAHLQVLSKRRALRETMGRIGYDHWKHCYCWPVVIQGWIDLIEHGRLQRKFAPPQSLVGEMEIVKSEISAALALAAHPC
jgi:glycosyltransferase involved in cell wall biosynthesis